MAQATRQIKELHGVKTPLEAPRFCSECGEELYRVLIGAEKHLTYDWGDAYYPYSKYSTKTGKRQYVHEWSCLHSSKYPWNKHDIYTDSKIFT